MNYELVVYDHHNNQQVRNFPCSIENDNVIISAADLTLALEIVRFTYKFDLRLYCDGVQFKVWPFSNAERARNH